MLQRRPVALKLPRGAWRRAALAERMAREREILARLNHPNIARLYDAGIDAQGQPYLALEYVEGERIDAYCRRNALDVAARLRLFLQVTRAVAHAHANLVVHRDLKPANILVAADGTARETELTQLAGRALTPDYAAPEQIVGEPIGTAADVYALGVVLFELLTGARPYAIRRDSRAALEEAILNVDPPRPSSVATTPKLRKRLRGDLDTIVLKALSATAPRMRSPTTSSATCSRAPSLRDRIAPRTGCASSSPATASPSAPALRSSSRSSRGRASPCGRRRSLARSSSVRRT
jgi:serine/threonine-protein kinase